MNDVLQRLLPGLTVLERGWLSSNNILFVGENATALVDSGYCTHADQTLALVQNALQGRTLDVLVNTHLHSDHCGGNSALQASYPQLQTHIPPGHAAQVAQWDANALTYTPTGQQCPRFGFSHTLTPGTQFELGGHAWQVHAAPGHDPHSVVLFEPVERILISADALWEHGFGVVFPELDGVHAFDEVAATLDVIEALKPIVVIPGHGAVFTDVTGALQRARKRLDGFVSSPRKHAAHGGKVLIKFKLLELQCVPFAQLQAWALTTPYFESVRVRYFSDVSAPDWINQLCADLVGVGAARRESDGASEWICNAEARR